MRKSKFSEHQIIAILKTVEAGRTVKDVCREHEISDATYYQWKSKYGGMQASDIKRLRELEEENRRRIEPFQIQIDNYNRNMNLSGGPVTSNQVLTADRRCPRN